MLHELQSDINYLRSLGLLKKKKCTPSVPKFTPEYQEYLKTSHWQERRNRILSRDRYECQGCGVRKLPQPIPGEKDPKLEVHHKRYPAKGSDLEAFITQTDDDFTTLCHQCHDVLTKSIRRRRKQKN